MGNHHDLQAALQLVKAPFAMMTGREIADAIRIGDPSEYSPTATYLIDIRDGMILAECLEEASEATSLRILNSQGQERWAEFASAQD